MTQPRHAHHFIAGTDPAKSPMVLHLGSGGDEHDLVPLAEELASGSQVLRVHGTIAIDGGFTFFHRSPDSVRLVQRILNRWRKWRGPFSLPDAAMFAAALRESPCSQLRLSTGWARLPGIRVTHTKIEPLPLLGIQ